ncbi:hypothetical protein C8Q79DRAFT_1012902 [Trametes meyenii]|nr:hypothetical protein C8Q79DRAFT_1012902 [Trametes meyenii]
MSGFRGHDFYNRLGPREDSSDELPPPRHLMGGVVVPALEELSSPEVTVLEGEKIVIEDLRCIASYTWQAQCRQPTIIVPGSPPEWRDSVLPIHVRFDNGIRMIDENGYCMRSTGTSPLAPIFRATDAMAEGSGADPQNSNDSSQDGKEVSINSIDWPRVDIITDRNNLRKLLRWIREREIHCDLPEPTADSSVESGSVGADDAAVATATPANYDIRKDFRIDLQLGGDKTVLMQRWAAFARERVVPPKGGCRDNFVREATTRTAECQDGAGHYRIVQYNLDGLNMVVRWEVDARTPDDTPPLSAEVSSDADSSMPDFPKTPTPSSIDQVARWYNADATSDEAKWGLAGSRTDTVAERGANPNEEIEQDVCPIEQVQKDVMTLDDAVAMWGNTDDNPAAAATAWGDPEPPKEAGETAKIDDNGAATWDVPFNNEAAAWGIVSPADDPTITTMDTQELKVVRAGTLVPQSSILELCTRSAQFINRTNIEDTFLQIFLTQTPVHLVAVHTRGSFDQVIRQELDSPDLAKFNDDVNIQKSLHQFAALLREIQKIVKRHGSTGKISLICEKGVLGVYSRVREEEDWLGADLERFRA